MDEQRVIRIEIRHTRTSPVYTEGETADVSHMNIGSIRHLRSLGLIEGEETGENIVTARKRSFNCGEYGGCNTIWAPIWQVSK